MIAGNFRVEKLIGTGAMGNVYKCEQLSLSKAVAVKVLHHHLMNDEKLVMRFQREAKSASLLNHPNSIQIIDSGQDHYGTLYIAMELLNGRDLAQVIRDDFPLSLSRIVRVMSQVLSALDEAHVQNVIHRDLKPSNIMLIERRGEKDFVKVCDFGIAKAQGPDAKEDRSAMLTIQGLVCGTPEYMAPEQARAEPLDGRADLYSAAVILYQLVTGDIPFRADSPMGIVSRHLSELPVPPSLQRPDLPIPPAIDALILRGMEKRRELRYPNALAFREELESVGAWLSGSGSGASARAAAPTAQMSGVPAGETAIVPSVSGAVRFGSTANLSPPKKRRSPLLLAALGLAGLAAAAMFVVRPRLGTQPEIATAPPAAIASSVAAVPTAAPPNKPPTAAPAPEPPPPAAAAAAPPTSATPSEPPTAPEAAAPSAPAHPIASPHERDAHRHKPPRAIASATPGAAAGAMPAIAPKAATGEASATVAATDDKTPAVRGPREVLVEGEKLLSQGEVKDACARGEEAKRMNPKFVLSYKFLGKCYMRAGDAGQANDNYRKYLELAPAASDALFIKSIVK
ncbi:MAG TPA: serine/threonine-protein kinase [Polyangia bacterium]